MPKRVIDFDAMWGSDKLASCAEWAQTEYAWLYGLADASGCFELTNLRVIWGRVAAIRRNLTIERLEQIFDEFQVKGLLFVWEHEGKRYGHWSGSDVPGRLPAPSWRMRLERLAPPVPKRQFAEYMSRFARGRAALAGGGFRAETEQEQFESSDLRFEKSKRQAIRGGCLSEERSERSDISNLKFEIPENYANRGRCRNGEQGYGSEIPDLRFEISDAKHTSERESGLRAFPGDGGLRPLKDAVEVAQAQDLNSDWKSGGEKNLCAPGNRASCGRVDEDRTQNPQNLLLDLNAKAQINPAACREDAGQRTRHPQNILLDSNANTENDRRDQRAHGASAGVNRAARTASAGATPAVSFQWRDKSDLLARELAVGRGPVCGPVKLNPKALERIRAREAARRAGSRSP